MITLPLVLVRIITCEIWILLLAVEIVRFQFIIENQIENIFFNIGNDVNIGHYFLENDESQPFEHRSKIGLLNSQVDSKTGFAWCSFARPFRPEATLDLNLDHHLYYFYFKGTINPDDQR